MHPQLKERIAPVVRRIQLRRVAISVSVIFAAATLIWLLAYAFKIEPGRLGPFSLWLLASTFLIAGLVAWVAWSKSNSELAVQKIEEEYPDAEDLITTACEQGLAENQRELGYLQHLVVRDAIFHSYDNPWHSVVPRSRLLGSGLLATACIGCFLAVLGFLPLTSPEKIADENVVNFADAEIHAAMDFEVVVEPGNTEVEAGTGLLVLAKFKSAVPTELTLHYKTADGESRQVPMQASLDDPVFGGRIPNIQKDTDYQVEFSNQQSNLFKISVFEFPTLIRSDVKIEYPEYTHLPDKVVQDFRRVSAVEGSQGNFEFHLNKPVQSATLVSQLGDSNETIKLVPSAERPGTYTTQLKFAQPGRKKFQLQLRDMEGRNNDAPQGIVVNTLENQPPELKLITPAPDIQVSALEEIPIQLKVYDDFGVMSVGLAYSLGGEDEEELLLVDNRNTGDGSGEKPISDFKKLTVDHTLALEEFGATADQFLTYYIWAEDHGPDGDLRRVVSEVYFAEVRPFEEIYRESQQGANGDQQQQQQQQQSGQNQLNAEQAQQLAELQKQIITATWNIIRRENGSEPSSKFGEDINVLIEAQAEAISQTAELAETVQDAESQTLVDEVRTAMNSTVSDFQNAIQKNSGGPLDSALKNAKSAYQGLLRLRAREHEVSKQQQQQQQQQQRSSQAQQQRQQQLNNLQMDTQQNRYEQQQLQQREEQEAQEQQENRQILSRLRELARRQNDLNERIKELQTALDEEMTELEQEEIQRELKRLRDQQQEIMRDADELNERMEQAQDQQAMSEPSQQLEKARENARQSAEALEEGRVSKAAAEGERTEEQLEELRDEFQNRTSGQFTEQVQKLRNEAQEIEQAEEQLQDRLEELNKDDSPQTSSLREQPDREKITEDILDQATRVEELRDAIKETIEEAEEYEPLLAEALYDTYRQLEQQPPEEILESVANSTKRGFFEDAVEQEKQAAEGIETLREGIEQAAESVLGDESRALEIARDKLQRLREELEAELNENNPQRAQNGNSNQTQEEQGGREQDGQRTDGPQQPGQQPAGEPSERAGAPNSSEQNPESQNEGESSKPSTQPGQPGQGNRAEQSTEPGEARNADDPDRRAGTPSQGRGQPNESEQPSSQQPPTDRPVQPGLRPEGEPAIGQPQTGSGGLTRGEFTPRPLTGSNFIDWADRLRDIEEMVNDPELRAEASRIRDAAKEIRKDFKRHSKEPNWNLVEVDVAEPLRELQQRLTEELIRKSNRDALIPLDRDPVPVEFQDAVQRYFQELGNGQ